MSEQELKEYQVQRKVIGWEQQTVMANNADEAIDLAEEANDWDAVYDASEATETYWVRNEDTGASAMRYEHEGWEEEID